jgi:predicted DNA-binding protein with PD1-like motif
VTHEEGAMRGKLVGENGGKTYVVIFETGDEAVSGLCAFAREQNLSDAHIAAIGAFQQVTVAYFDWRTKEYQHIPIVQQVEVLSLVGDIALKDGEPMLHAHVVVGKRDGSAHGGHLIEGIVRPTLEVVIQESPVHLHREHDAASGLALIKL